MEDQWLRALAKGARALISHIIQKELLYLATPAKLVAGVRVLVQVLKP